MVKSLYLANNRQPFEDKQFDLVLRIFEGPEVEYYTVAKISMSRARDIASTGQVGWTDYEPELTKCKFCNQMLVEPCTTAIQMADRSRRFPKSKCVEQNQNFRSLVDGTPNIVEALKP